MSYTYGNKPLLNGCIDYCIKKNGYDSLRSMKPLNNRKLKIQKQLVY